MNIGLPSLRLPLASLLLAAAQLACAQGAAPKVEGAWARPTVAGQSAGGGFLRITGGSAADKLVAARTPVSPSVELHTMTMDGDVMRMRAIDAIAVPAGKTVELKPGGLHLMFVGLQQPLAAGAQFPLTLRFEKAGEVTVQVKVTATPPAGADAAHGHKH
jgi:copper(I)-binding protein